MILIDEVVCRKVNDLGRSKLSSGETRVAKNENNHAVKNVHVCIEGSNKSS